MMVTLRTAAQTLELQEQTLVSWAVLEPVPSFFHSFPTELLLDAEP